MKKSVLFFACVAFSTALIAQESTDKKVQMGLAYQFGMNFNKPGTKIIERDGVGVQNMIGMNINFSFNQNIGLATGLEFDFESFKYDVKTTDLLYYRYNDSKILQKDEVEEGQAGDLYNLQSRKQKATYATIPLMLLFRTNMIGAFRYYGKFGARSSFLLSNTMNDRGFAINESTMAAVTQNNDNMKAKGDMAFFRSSVGIAAGAEWNFTGNTSVFAELGFYYGFTNIHQGKAITGDEEKNMTMYQNISGVQDYTTFSAKQKQMVLKVGILF